MDPQSQAFTPYSSNNETWRLQSDLVRFQQVQAEQVVHHVEVAPHGARDGAQLHHVVPPHEVDDGPDGTGRRRGVSHAR